MTLPEIPRPLTDPRRFLAVGTAAWVVATVVVWGSDFWPQARPICLLGIAVGVLGYGIYLVQRRGARRGDKGAQTGL